MILLIDMGNQRLKWALLSAPFAEHAHQIIDTIPVHSGICNVRDLLARGGQSVDQVSDILPWPDTAPQSIWVSSVSNAAAATMLTRLCQSRWRQQPKFVSSPPAFDRLTNYYDRPDQLGVDRWLAALAAYQLAAMGNQTPGVLVIDAGTAVTVDLVYDNGFRGGAILPGLKLITQSLGSNTGRIRLDDQSLVNRVSPSHDNQVTTQHPSRTGSHSLNQSSDTPFNLCATNSVQAVNAGAMAAVLGGVRFCLSEAMRLRDSGVTKSLPIVLTGGDAGIVAADLSNNDEMQKIIGDVEVVPNLVLGGLAITAIASVDHQAAASTGSK